MTGVMDDGLASVTAGCTCLNGELLQPSGSQWAVSPIGKSQSAHKTYPPTNHSKAIYRTLPGRYIIWQTADRDILAITMTHAQDLSGKHMSHETSSDIVHSMPQRGSRGPSQKSETTTGLALPSNRQHPDEGELSARQLAKRGTAMTASHAAGSLNMRKCVQVMPHNTNLQMLAF